MSLWRMNNARLHSKKQLRQIVASINRFGFTNPALVDESDNILAGHGRVRAAIEIGLSIPCRANFLRDRPSGAHSERGASAPAHVQGLRRSVAALRRPTEIAGRQAGLTAATTIKPCVKEEDCRVAFQA